jgi:hypothetical protein
MAKLLGSHPLDCCRFCDRCTTVTEARYDGAQLLSDGRGGIQEGRQFTCLVCGNTYNADFEPRPDIEEDRLLEVTDLRVWHRRRQAEASVEVPKPQPPRVSAFTLLGLGRYSIVRGGAA